MALIFTLHGAQLRHATQQAASFEFGELDNFRPGADEVLHTPPSATFLYHMKLHQGNTYMFWACLHAHSSTPFQSQALQTGLFLSGIHHLHLPLDTPPIWPPLLGGFPSPRQKPLMPSLGSQEPHSLNMSCS